MKRTFLTTAIIVSGLSLSACGYSPGDRALSGGMIGAAAGAATGAAFGAPLQGAVVGGVLGAATGALTNPNEVQLGRPVWR
jgi:osmotically inducible lipoprotein OsmB